MSVDPSGLQADLRVKPPPGWKATARVAACSSISPPLIWRTGSPTSRPEGVTYSFVYALKGCCKDVADAAKDAEDGDYYYPGKEDPHVLE